jgi:hypothetical protein
MKGFDPAQITFDDLFAAPSDRMTEQKLIERQLKFGSGFERGKERILAKFAEHPAIKVFADFLRDEYGCGGWSFKSEAQWHNSQGVKMEWRSKENPLSVSLTWTQVAEHISKMILKGSY